MALITVERCFFVISYEGVMSTVVGIQGVMFQVSRLPNGLTVASLDMAGAVSQLVIAFRAGARYEEPREAGLVHHLRNAVGIDSKNYLGAQMLWQCGSVGANLMSTMSRDLFAVQMSVLRDHASVALSLLGELAQSAFKPWDMEEVYGTLYIDRAYLQPRDILNEKLHAAAFRNGPLGNQLYAKTAKIGKINSNQLIDFAASRLVSGNAVLVGVNVDHSQVLGYASTQLAIPEAAAKSTAPSQYRGGEVRHNAVLEMAHVAVVGEGASLQDHKGMAAQAVLSAALANGAATKYSSALGHGAVAQAVYKQSGGNMVAVAPVNEIHSDAALVGVYLAANGGVIRPLVKAAVDAMKSLRLDDTTLSAAKICAEVDALTACESSSTVAMDRAAQLLASGRTLSAGDFIQLIRNVTTDDINKAAERLTKKLSIASHGSITQVPYLDEL
uniref:Peptidase M16 N-terminal domain-containing protein n=1 Tax=Ascaris lumbricoides TaxID=6252 RepID=A0A9J2NZ92_ASCLU